MPDAWNVELVGYHHLDGRPGFKLALQEVDVYYFLYIGSLWHSGWSVVDVTDPTRPSLVRWIEGPPDTWTIQVQAAERKLITALEPVPQGWGGGEEGDAVKNRGFLTWDIAEPDNPRQVGYWQSGGLGTHRNFYRGGNLVHCASGFPDIDGQIYACVDIADPSSPRLAGRWWWPGQNTGAGENYSEADQKRLRGGIPYLMGDQVLHGLSLHGGAYAEAGVAYCPWTRAGLVMLDISAPEHPVIRGHLPVYPPLGSSIAVHSAVPLPRRRLVVINSESLYEAEQEPACFAGLVDVSDIENPYLISLLPRPRGRDGSLVRNARRGGRFGPHNQHQHQGQECLLDDDQHVFLTYFSGGLQIFDIADPRDPHIVAYFVPDDPVTRYGPQPSELVAQVEDVLVDRRGFIYITEKNSGLYCLGWTGTKSR